MPATRVHGFPRFIFVCVFAALPAICAAPLPLPIPIDLARHSQGANLLLLDPATQTYQPTEAAADWLDDCVGTGRLPEKGHHYYLLKFSTAQTFKLFNIDTKGCAGTVALYGGDEPLPPGKSWRPLASLDIASLGPDKKGQSLNYFSQYLLIESNLREVTPWYDIHVFGDTLAEGLHLRKRDKPLNVRSVGMYVNVKTSISLSSVTANATVISADPTQLPTDLQMIIDDNPATGAAISAPADWAIILGGKKQINRVAVLAAAGERGTLEVAVTNERLSVPDRDSSGAASSGLPTAAPSVSRMSAGGLRVASFTFDGRNSRMAADFPPISATALVLRWKPESPSKTLFIREVDAFGEETLEDYEYRPLELASGPSQAASAARAPGAVLPPRFPPGVSP